MASLDGCRKTAKVDDKEVEVVGHGVVASDGSVWRTKMEGGDNYLAELWAQVRWAWETKAKRYVVILDALSCPESLRRYVWMGDKKRAAKYARRELCKWWKGLEDAEAVVFIWQTSHVGELRNSWADVVADEAAVDGEAWRCSYRDLPYASIDFLEPACGLRQCAAGKFGKRVVQKLGETSTYTLLVDEQHFGIKLPSYMQGIASAVRGGRAQVGDVARYCEKDISCPAGCSAGGEPVAFTWLHVAFACEHPRCVSRRGAWRGELKAFSRAAGLTEPHAGAIATIKAIDTGTLPAERSRSELKLRAVAGGAVSIGLNSAVKDCKPLVESMVKAGLSLQLAGKQLTAEREKEWKASATAMRLTRPLVRRWRDRVARAGPEKARRLRVCAEATAWAMATITSAMAVGGMSRGAAGEAVKRVVAMRKKEATLGASGWHDEDTLSTAVKSWWAEAYLCKLRALAARTRGGRRAEVSRRHLTIASEAMGARMTAARGWAEIAAESDGGVRFATALTRTGGGGVAWKISGGDGWELRADTAWSMACRLGGRRTLAKRIGEEMRAGRLGDKRGRWAVEDLLDVRRPGGSGRRLDVLVSWAGNWRDDWRSVVLLTNDMRKRARVMEVGKYGAKRKGVEPQGDDGEEGRVTRARAVRGFGGGMRMACMMAGFS